MVMRWHGGFLNGVRVTLSNGEKSLKFRGDEGDYNDHQTLIMVPDVSKIEINCYSYSVTGLRFSN